MNSKLKLIDKISSALPQLQCKKCGYEDCISYASAVVNQKEDLNKCEPGLQKTKQQLENILQGVEKISLNEIKNYQIATIEEDECIGCTICIKVCPVDAIVGAKQQKHFIINQQCNGCELCISQCPVDCMKMIDNKKGISWSWPSNQANKSKDYYNNKLTRIEIIRKEKESNRKSSQDKRSIQDYIKDAIDREERKYKKMKEYG